MNPIDTNQASEDTQKAPTRTLSEQHAQRGTAAGPIISDTNQAGELLGLCKKVYEKTGWIVGDESWDWHTTTDAKLDSMFVAPKYYTDYLLEKLSAITDYVSIQQRNKISIDARNGEKGNWYAHYWLKSRRVQVKSDTQLKALLKLTVALSEAGELK